MPLTTVNLSGRRLEDETGETPYHLLSQRNHLLPFFIDISNMEWKTKWNQGEGT